MEESETAAEPLSLGAIVIFWTVLVLGTVYAGFGVRYAADESAVRAGAGVVDGVVMFCVQVGLWPVLAAQ